MTTKRFKWVDEVWVADGFDLSDERAKDMLASDLGWAQGHEFGARVLKAPSSARIARAQGYVTTKRTRRAEAH